MPSLKQINCSVELGSGGTKLKEYGHRYTDGGVEAFIALPNTNLKIPFGIHITSNGYIAPGLAAYVFMDGEYQCNRNRQKLQLPADGVTPREYEIDFKLRQKEEKTADGLFVGREWTFAELKTKNADKAPNTNPMFAQNVGTIEVVILRCKSQAAQDPDETVIDAGEALAVTPPLSAAGSKAASVARSAKVSEAKPPSKVASKVASKEPSKEPSAAGSFVGGMLGLFDGAGDDPGYERFPHRHRQRQDAYEDSRYSPRPFTVHNGQGHRNAEPREHYQRGNDGRPRTANDHYAPPRTPHTTYDWEKRHRPRVASTVQTPVQHGIRHGYGPRPPASIVTARPSAPPGFSFITDQCKHIDSMQRQSFEEAQKLRALRQEAQVYEYEPEVHLAAVKAVKHKEQEILSLGEELESIFHSIVARMRRMDEVSWRYTRDYLVMETRLVRPDHPDMQHWPDPRLRQQLQSPQHDRTRSSGAIDDAWPSPQQPRSPQKQASSDGRPLEWEEVGQGATGLSLAERQRRKYSANDNQKPASVVWPGKSQQNGNGNEAGNDWGADGGAAQNDMPGAWGSPDEIDNQSNHDNPNDNRANSNGSNRGGGAGGWAGNNDNQSQKGNANAKRDTGASQKGGNGAAWDSQSKAKTQGGNNAGWDDQVAAKSHGGGGWPGDNKDAKPQESASQNQGWNNDGGGSRKSGNKQNDNWANAADNNQAGGWGNDNADQARSQSHHSKVKGWNDGSKKAKSSAGDWQNVGGGAVKASSKSNSRKASTSVALEPIIKPYWADWNKSRTDAIAPRIKARDPYDYPAPSTVLAPSNKPKSVSHGVQAGKGANYYHKTFKPEYLDTMDKPYAIFTFKYRSRTALEKILNRKIDTSDVQRAVDEAEKERLMRLPKDELVQEIQKLKVAPAKSSSSGKAASEAKPPSNKSAWGAKPASAAKPAASGWGNAAPVWGDQAKDEVRPNDSVSQRVESGRSQRPDASAQDKNRETKDPSVKAWSANKEWNGGGGGDAWQEDQKSNKASSRTAEHFAGDPGLKTAGEQKPAQSWGNAGW